MTLDIKKWMNDGARALQFFGALRFLSILLIGIILVKCNYSVQDVSQFEWYFFIASSFSFFISHAVNKSILSNGHRKSDLPILLFSLVSMIIASCLALAYSYEFLHTNKGLVFALSLSLPIANSLEYYLLTGKRLKLIYWAGITFPLLTLLFVLFAAINSWSVPKIVQGLIAINIFKSIFTLFFVKIKGDISWSFSAKLYKSFFLIALISGLMSYVDGYLVKWLFPDYAFSVFRYGARELPLINIIITSLASAYVISIQDKEDNWDVNMKNRLSKMIKWMFPLAALIFFISPRLFGWFFSMEYQESALFFNIYLLMILCRIFIGQSLLLAYSHERFLVKLSIIELIVNVVLSIALANIIGIAGIIWATFIAFAVEKIYMIYFIQKKMKIQISSFFPVKNYALYSSVLIIAFIIVQVIDFLGL